MTVSRRELTAEGDLGAPPREIGGAPNSPSAVSSRQETVNFVASALYISNQKALDLLRRTGWEVGTAIDTYLWQQREARRAGRAAGNSDFPDSSEDSEDPETAGARFRSRAVPGTRQTPQDPPSPHAPYQVRGASAVQLLDEVESGENLTKRQKTYHQRTKTRDLALLSLMLGTGIRVSECVGLDLNDVDLKNNGVKVHRKGGAEVVVYFGDEVRDALCGYLAERVGTTPATGHENALFLSMQNRRLSVRSVENLVKKYAKIVTSLKNITPHKLRSTYGTNLYQETGDIYLVADVLGHKDVNTTRKHYAAIEDERRRKAAKYVHLREP